MPITLEKTKTFLYQEGLMEGKMEGRMEGKMEAIENNIEKLFCKGMKPEAIAYNLELDISVVYATLTKKGYQAD